MWFIHLRLSRAQLHLHTGFLTPPSSDPYTCQCVAYACIFIVYICIICTENELHKIKKTGNTIPVLFHLFLSYTRTRKLTFQLHIFILLPFLLLLLLCYFVTNFALFECVATSARHTGVARHSFQCVHLCTCLLALIKSKSNQQVVQADD